MQSDNISQEGIGMIILGESRGQETFCGWIREWEITRVRDLLQQEDQQIHSTIWEITRRFRWMKGGGRCVEGIVCIVW